LSEIELLVSYALALDDSRVATVYETTEITVSVGKHSMHWMSPLVRIAVRVYEADGQLLQSTEAKVPETVLHSGMLPALELYTELAARAASSSQAPAFELSDGEARIIGEGLLMLPTLLGILQGDSVLKSLLMEVVGTPSLLSLLRGIHVNVSCELDKASRVTDHESIPDPSGSVYRVPIGISVN